MNRLEALVVGVALIVALTALAVALLAARQAQQTETDFRQHRHAHARAHGSPDPERRRRDEGPPDGHERRTPDRYRSSERRGAHAAPTTTHQAAAQPAPAWEPPRTQPAADDPTNVIGIPVTAPHPPVRPRPRPTP